MSVVNAIADQRLQGLLRYPDAAPLIEFLQSVRESVEARSARSIVDVVSSQLFVPADDETLFELMTGFAMIDALTEAGYELRRITPATGGRTPFARLARNGDDATLWWQRSLRSLPIASGGDSRYHLIAAAAGIRKSSLRPDFVVMSEALNRVLLIEVKHTVRDGSVERAGVTDSLAYIHDSEDVFQGRPWPYGLVVAWNAQGTPALAEVMISSIEDLASAVAIAGF